MVQPKSETISLCLRCGARKAGPLLICPNCHHEPTDLTDQAKHFLVAAFGLSEEQALAASERIAGGGSLEFSPDAVQTAEGALRADRPDAHWKLFWWLIAPLIVAGLLAVAWFAWWR